MRALYARHRSIVVIARRPHALASGHKEVGVEIPHNWWRDLVFLLLGALLSWVGNYYYYNKAQRGAEAAKDQEIARYVVAAMLSQHPVQDSYDLQQRIDQYLAALRRTKADHRGTPGYRENGSIGVDWSINIKENLSINPGR